MRILGIDASAKTASVCIWQDGTLLSEAFSNNGLTHSKTVLLMICDMLKQNNIDLSSIDKIAISNGPGSFTGLRIGAAVVKGLSWSCDIPCVGVSTLEALAQNACVYDGLVSPVMDARAGQVYQASFRCKDGVLTRVCEDRAIAISELESELQNEEKIVFLGDGAKLCFDGVAHENKILVPEQLRYQRAYGVCALAELRAGVPADKLEIEYIRKPQAERERLAKLNKE